MPRHSRRLALSAAALGACLLLARWATVSGAADDGTPPRLPAEGGLSFDVRDARTGEHIPCKLTLVGVDGTRDPALTRTDIGRQEGDAIAAYNRIMSLTGVGAVHVPNRV